MCLGSTLRNKAQCMTGFLCCVSDLFSSNSRLETETPKASLSFSEILRESFKHFITSTICMTNSCWCRAFLHEDNLLSEVYQETWEIMFAMQISLQNTNLIHCASHLSWRDQCSTAAVHEPRRIRILLVLRMSLRIAALNNGNILSCSDQRISELQYINRLNQSRCLQSPCDAKLKWTTSVHLDPQKHQQDFIQLIGLKAKIQKLTQNHKSAGKKDEVSAVSQLSPRHPHKGHTHGVPASPDRHSHHLPWLDHAISCVCVWVKLCSKEK